MRKNLRHLRNLRDKLIFSEKKKNSGEEKDPREENRVGGKRSSFSPTFRFPTSHTTVRAVPHTAVPILGAIRCMNPSM